MRGFGSSRRPRGYSFSSSPRSSSRCSPSSRDATVSCTVTLDCLSLSSIHPSSSSSTPLLSHHLLAVLCRHPWRPFRCHLFFRPGCLPSLLLLPLLLRLLLHSLVFGLPSSVQSSLGSSRCSLSFSGCFGQLYRHTGLPEPQLPTPQQLQFDPTTPAPPVGGFVQTPLASFLMSPLVQTRLFASPVPTAAPARDPQPSIWIVEQHAEFLRQQQVLHQLQHPSAQSLTFDSPSQPEVLRLSVVRPTQPDLTPVTSAPPTDSTVVTEPVATATPATSAGSDDSGRAEVLFGRRRLDGRRRR